MATTRADTDFLDTLKSAESRDDMFASLATELQSFGIGGYGYGFTIMRSSRGPASDLDELHFHHTYPQSWRNAVGDDTKQNSDATAILLFEGRTEVDWTALRPEAERLGPDVLRQYDMAQDLGIRCGVGLRLGEDNNGRILSGIGLWYADTTNPAAFRADWARDRAEIRHLLHLFDLTVRGDRADLVIGLSCRERDALSYLAAGYRSAEASWNMRISEKTFEKHVCNAKVKLSALTRDHAVAKALVMGLIEP